MKIAQIREIIRSGLSLRLDLGGATAEEFAKMNVGARIDEKLAEISGLNIAERHQVERMKANDELEALRKMKARWEAKQPAK